MVWTLFFLCRFWRHASIFVEWLRLLRAGMGFRQLKPALSQLARP
ncbi:putative competence protein [Acetobacter orientalis]|uniref:Putative competence protein n=1 Tax=Acetobacter orientalis TaxID=146474 RepID=A0A2Z5ZLS7_9PROT|nr:putative competence protein [Acetobacter orientalis]